MWYRLKSTILFQLKKLEIGFETWKQSIEIRKAYRERLAIAINKKQLLTIVISLFLVVVLSAAVFFGAKAISSAYTAISKSVSEMHSRQRQDRTHPAFSKKIFFFNKKDKNQQGKAYAVAADSSMAAAVSAPIDSGRLKMIRTLWKPSDELQLLILANKATLRMSLLLYKDSIWSLIREYEIVTGRNAGQKETEGDFRTPEGLYFIIGKKDYNELDDTYGPVAYVLNYPNDEDRKAGRTGQGIWIHGTYWDSMLAPSKGCLKMRNTDILDLARRIGIGISTPVIIINDSAATVPVVRMSFAEISKRRNALITQLQQMQIAYATVLNSWKLAWEAKDVASFAGYYATGALSQGQTMETFLAQKVRTFRNYQTISIKLDSIIVSDLADSIATVRFLQNYASNISQMVNGKKMVLKKSGGEWRIYRELTFPKEELLL